MGGRGGGREGGRGGGVWEGMEGGDGGQGGEQQPACPSSGDGVGIGLALRNSSSSSIIIIIITTTNNNNNTYHCCCCCCCCCCCTVSPPPPSAPPSPSRPREAPQRQIRSGPGSRREGYWGDLQPRVLPPFLLLRPPFLRPLRFVVLLFPHPLLLPPSLFLGW